MAKTSIGSYDLECQFDFYNTIRWSLMLILLVNVLIFLIFIIIKTVNDESISASQYGAFAASIAAIFGIIGGWRDDFWLIVLCEVFEVVALILFLVNEDYLGLIVPVIILVLAIVYLILLARRGRAQKMPCSA